MAFHGRKRVGARGHCRQAPEQRGPGLCIKVETSPWSAACKPLEVSSAQLRKGDEGRESAGWMGEPVSWAGAIRENDEGGTGLPRVMACRGRA